MTWDLTWGKQLKFLQEMKDDGLDPQALRDRPVLDKVQAYYMDAFQVITDSRRYTYGQPIPIPLSEILSYCQLFYIDSLLEREQLVRVVQALDNTYLKVTSEQSKPASEK